MHLNHVLPHADMHKQWTWYISTSLNFKRLVDLLFHILSFYFCHVVNVNYSLVSHVLLGQAVGTDVLWSVYQNVLQLPGSHSATWWSNSYNGHEHFFGQEGRDPRRYGIYILVVCLILIIFIYYYFFIRTVYFVDQFMYRYIWIT